MKEYIYITGAALTMLSFASCGNEWLDLQPSNAVNSKEAIVDVTSAQTALIGVYDGVQGNSTYSSYYAARMFYYGDVRGDDMQASQAGMRTSSCYEMNYTVNDAPNMWNIPYNVVRRATSLIHAIETGAAKAGNDAEQEELNNIKAQALVIRALGHFDLCRVYAMPYTYDNGASLGVPVVTEPLGKDALPARSPVKDVYAQVVKDLTTAIATNALPTEKTPGYINLWAAKALLARVYLYMNDNAKALTTAKDIIDNSPYKLWTNEEYPAAWNKSNGAHSNEVLFEIINYDNSDWGDREGIAYLMSEDGYADLCVTSAFNEVLDEDPNDVRQQVILPSTYDEDIEAFGDARIWVNKYPADAQGEMRTAPSIVFRLSEVYLNAAEAAVKLGKTADAQTYLNAIVKRANPDKMVSEADVTLNRVLKERRKELVGEGHRFFDLMRNNLQVVRYTSLDQMGRHYDLVPESQKFDRTYYRAILPIPLSETNVNKNLAAQQNPGY